jgi:hypothetical protein
MKLDFVSAWMVASGWPLYHERALAEIRRDREREALIDPES